MAGCLSRLLDAPYVLCTGLEGATQLDWGKEPAPFLVTTTAGVRLVDQGGGVTASPTAPPARAPVRAGAVVAVGDLWADAEGVLWNDGAVVLSGLVHPRAMIRDRWNRAYVVAGEPEPALYRIDAGSLTLIAEWLGPVTDVAWGSGGWLLADTLYLVRSDGVLEYLQPPGAPEGFVGR